MSKIDIERLLAEADAGEYVGACTECGEFAYGVEPDAKDYRCEACGTYAVTGVETLLIGSV
jgi:hypothetical protein